MADGERTNSGKISSERLEALLRQNLRWLRGWLGARLRGVDRQDVDDLCQDVLLRAIRGVESLRDPSRFPSWLYRIASNVLRDHVRDATKRRKETREVEPDSTAALNGQHSSGAARAERREDFERAIDALLDLPSRYREPMLLRHVDDLCYEEIAAILGISTGAVQVRISRARDRLRKTRAYREIYGSPVSSSASSPGGEAKIIDLDAVASTRAQPRKRNRASECGSTALRS